MEVAFHRLAAQEYLAARRWYASRSPRTAANFVLAVDRAVEQIISTPETGAPFDDRRRWVRLRRFPYLLVYTLLDDTHILILAVAHARRRSGYSRRRHPGS